MSEGFYEEKKIVQHNIVDRQGACTLLREMRVWSERLSDSLDELHAFQHTGEGDPQELVEKILMAKDMIAIMWGVPFPQDDGMYALVGQSPSTTLN